MQFLHIPALNFHLSSDDSIILRCLLASAMGRLYHVRFHPFTTSALIKNVTSYSAASYTCLGFSSVFQLGRAAAFFDINVQFPISCAFFLKIPSLIFKTCRTAALTRVVRFNDNIYALDNVNASSNGMFFISLLKII